MSYVLGHQFADFQGLQCEDPRLLVIVEDHPFHVLLFVIYHLLTTVAPVPLHHDPTMMDRLVTLIAPQNAFLLAVPHRDHLFLFPV